MVMSENDRYKFLERSFDNFFEVMDREKQHEPFMEFCSGLGYSAVSEYVLDPNNYQVLFPENDTLNIAQKASSKLPITALRFGEKVEVVSGAHYLHGPSISTEHSQEVTLPDDSTIASIFFRQHLKESTEDSVTLRRYQPLFIANFSDDYAKHDYLCPTTVGHELIHLAQNLSQPEDSLSASQLDYELAVLELNHEIEAYAYQDQLFEPMIFDMGRLTSASMAGVIDAIRRSTLIDGYKSNEAFIKKARANEFAQRILPEALQA